MTLSDLEWPFYVNYCFLADCASRIFCMDVVKDCNKTNKGRSVLSAAEVFGIDCSFWQYKVYAGIHGGSPDFYEPICRSGYLFEI